MCPSTCFIFDSPNPLSRLLKSLSLSSPAPRASSTSLSGSGDFSGDFSGDLSGDLELPQSTVSGSSSNFPDSTVRPFSTLFSSQSATTPGFQGTGGPNGSTRLTKASVFHIPSSLASRDIAMTGVPSSGVPQPGGSISSGRFSPSNISVAVSQISQGSAHGHTGMTNRGGISIVGNHAFISNMSGVAGSISGFSSASATASGNRSTVPGLGVSPILGNVGPQLASSFGSIVGGGANTGRSINPVGGLASHVNLAVNSGSGSLNVQGSNGLIGGMLQQVPQMLGVLGNSNTASGGSLSQNQVRGSNNLPSSMGMLNDVKSNDKSPFDLNDFPQLTTQRSSMGGAQGQMGLTRKQGVGVSSIVQQSQEFSIQNEDFPALPACKGGSSDFSTDMHQKEHFHENMPMIPSQHFPMARSAGFILGGTYPSSYQQQQQHAATVSTSGVTFSTGSNQHFFQLHGSNHFPSSWGAYHSQIQNSGPSSIEMRPVSSPNQVLNLGAYEQLVQQYQHQHNLSQFRLQEMSAAVQPYREQSLKSSQGAQSAPDRFGLLGLFGVIGMGVSGLASLALGIDLTTLGLNMSSSDNLYKTFRSPWSDEPAKGEPQHSSPSCYSSHPPSPLQEGHFSKFDLRTLFYIFYSMPKDAAQLYAASELSLRGWLYHKEYQLWFMRVSEPLVRTNTYERASYLCFDPNSWETIPKDNVVIYFDAVEKIPTPST